MSRVRVYLKTYDSSGVLWDEFVEITKYVDISTIGTLTQQLDNTEYDIGIVRNSNVNLKVMNSNGLFSTPDIATSLFRYKRDDSIIRITWNKRDYDLLVGFFSVCDEEVLFDDVTVFEGILNDDSTSESSKDQQVTFQVLGYESLLARAKVPFSSIANGDLISAVIYDCLNQAPLTNFVDVDVANISLGTDVTIDDVTGLENKSVLDALKELLFLSNSILYIDTDNVIHVKTRAPTAALQFTFYGPSSDIGIENLADISEIRSGVNRIFNYITWHDTSLAQSDSASITENGTKIKKITSELITDNTKRNTILSNILADFKIAKKELTIKAPILSCQVPELFLLDKVAIDYPQIAIPSSSGVIPLYGQAVYGVDRYPFGLLNLVIETVDEWKIMDRKFDLKNEMFTFKLRAV